MKPLIYKELHTVFKPYLYVFCLMPLLILIPSYPYFVAFGFAMQAAFLYLNETRLNNDIIFTSLLPVSRSRIVFIKHFGICFLQLLMLLIAIPFAVLSSYVINLQGNMAGLDANMTLFGFILIDLAAFNVVCLPAYFKNCYRVGGPVILGLAAFIALQVVFEFSVGFIPALKNVLDGVAAETAGYRAAVLAAGIAIYAAATFASYKLSVKNFEKVSL